MTYPTESTQSADIETGEETRIVHHDLPEKQRTFGRNHHKNRIYLISALIVLLSMAASAAFLWLGISRGTSEQTDLIQRNADRLIREIQDSWNVYQSAALWIHGTCSSLKENLTHEVFHNVYEYALAQEIDFHGAVYVPQVTSQEQRRALEADTRAFFQKYYPNVTHGHGIDGFNGMEPDGKGGFSIQLRSVQPRYFPVHYIEPVVPNAAAYDFDLYSSPSRAKSIDYALANWKPSLTGRITLVQETEAQAYSVLLMHPGIPLSTQPNAVASTLANLVIRIPSLLARSVSKISRSSCVYIYDSTVQGEDAFLGAARVDAFDVSHTITNLNEIDLPSAVRLSGQTIQQTVDIANRKWTILVLPVAGTYQANQMFVILGGTVIMIGGLCAALWVVTNNKHIKRMNAIKAQSEAEKAALIVQNAQQATYVYRFILCSRICSQRN
jgi:CHASE1-domain containing sensor protein